MKIALAILFTLLQAFAPAATAQSKTISNIELARRQLQQAFNDAMDSQNLMRPHFRGMRFGNGTQRYDTPGAGLENLKKFLTDTTIQDLLLSEISKAGEQEPHYFKNTARVSIKTNNCTSEWCELDTLVFQAKYQQKKKGRGEVALTISDAMLNGGKIFVWAEPDANESDRILLRFEFKQ